MRKTLMRISYEILIETWILQTLKGSFLTYAELHLNLGK